MEYNYSELAKNFGVVGAGGAGFPTQLKLNSKIEYLIINGAECEPLMTVDQVLVLNYAEMLAETMEEIRQETGAKEAIISIKAKHSEVIDVMQKAVADRLHVRVNPLGDFYPAGDEYVLVYETIGRQIPQGGIPLDCGAVVLNVETLWNLAMAKSGKPVTKKWVTVAGAVAQPSTYYVPLGVSTGEMLNLAGGVTIPDYSVINGGPMMGKPVKSLEEPVTKTTKGILVLPNQNPVILSHQRSVDSMLKQAMSLCCQCQICSDLCPRGLLGYRIHPNKTILAASYGFAGPEKGSCLEALMCSECGACDMYACPMGLSPRRINQMLKGLLAKERVANPYKGQQGEVSQWRQYRRIPSKRLVARLNLHYISPAVWNQKTCDPTTVLLPLRQHIGAPSQPVVSVGDSVQEGQLIACTAGNTPVSSNLFASIEGKIQEITQDAIVIRKA